MIEYDLLQSCVVGLKMALDTLKSEPPKRVGRISLFSI